MRHLNNNSSVFLQGYASIITMESGLNKCSKKELHGYPRIPPHKTLIRTEARFYKDIQESTGIVP